jgi:hypothetical protein
VPGGNPPPRRAPLVAPTCRTRARGYSGVQPPTASRMSRSAAEDCVAQGVPCPAAGPSAGSMKNSISGRGLCPELTDSLWAPTVKSLGEKSDPTGEHRIGTRVREPRALICTHGSMPLSRDPPVILVWGRRAERQMPSGLGR